MPASRTLLLSDRNIWPKSDPATMESRLLPGLYFAGELIDTDAHTGGYNLQIAFSTGALAGYSAALRGQAKEGASDI